LQDYNAASGMTGRARACEETTMPIIPKGPLTENVGKRIKGQPANPDSAENVH